MTANRGRKYARSPETENIIKEPAHIFANIFDPLFKQGLKDLAEDYVGMHESECLRFRFNIHRPSRLCVDSLSKRRQLSCRRVYTIESSCIDAMTPQNFAEHLARVFRSKAILSFIFLSFPLLSF